MAKHVLGCRFTVEESVEKGGKKYDAPETGCPRCPGGGSRKLQEQSAGFYLGGSCMVSSQGWIFLNFFSFYIFYFFPICNDGTLMNILNWCEWTRYQALCQGLSLKQTKISSLPTMNSKFSKAIFKNLLNIFSVLQYISKRAQSRVCEFHREDRASSALEENWSWSQFLKKSKDFIKKWRQGRHSRYSFICLCVHFLSWIFIEFLLCDRHWGTIVNKMTVLPIKECIVQCYKLTRTRLWPDGGARTKWAISTLGKDTLDDTMLPSLEDIGRGKSQGWCSRRDDIPSGGLKVKKVLTKWELMQNILGKVAFVCKGPFLWKGPGMPCSTLNFRKITLATK